MIIMIIISLIVVVVVMVIIIIMVIIVMMLVMLWHQQFGRHLLVRRRVLEMEVDALHEPYDPAPIIARCKYTVLQNRRHSTSYNILCSNLGSIQPSLSSLLGHRK